jgi:hypothetical protein
VHNQLVGNSRATFDVAVGGGLSEQHCVNPVVRSRHGREEGKEAMLGGAKQRERCPSRAVQCRAIGKGLEAFSHQLSTGPGRNISWVPIRQLVVMRGLPCSWAECSIAAKSG